MWGPQKQKRKNKNNIKKKRGKAGGAAPLPYGCGFAATMYRVPRAASPQSPTKYSLRSLKFTPCIRNLPSMPPKRWGEGVVGEGRGGCKKTNVVILLRILINF